MNDEREAWVAIATELYNASGVINQILCPSCKRGILEVIDISLVSNDLLKGGERIIRCKWCNKYEAILFKTLPPNFGKFT